MQSKTTQTIWTPANIVTVARIVLVPLWLAFAEALHTAGLFYKSHWLAWLLFALYLFISLTDKLDGYLARSRNEVTNFGKFLDPIADKLAVLVAMIFLLEMGLCSSWAVLLVLFREFLVSGLRMLVASEGTVVAASNLGKAKTATTMLALCGLLLVLTLDAHLGFVVHLQTASDLLLLVAMILTAWSGIDYFLKCWPIISKVD